MIGSDEEGEKNFFLSVFFDFENSSISVFEKLVEYIMLFLFLKLLFLFFILIFEFVLV